MNIKFITNSILSILLLVGFKNIISAEADTNAIYNNLTKFMDLTEKNKNNWLNFEKECHNGKIDLIIKHINEHFKLKREHLNEVQKAGTVTPELLNNKLDSAIKLHESQMKDWADLHKKQMEKATELATDHNTEFNKFKNSLAGADKTTETEVEEVEVIETK